MFVKIRKSALREQCFYNIYSNTYYRTIINTTYNTQLTKYYKADIYKHISFSSNTSLMQDPFA